MKAIEEPKTAETCAVCQGPMGPESAEGYCSMKCFDVALGHRGIVHRCHTCGKPVKPGCLFCRNLCHNGKRRSPKKAAA